MEEYNSNIQLSDLISSYPDIHDPNFEKELFYKKELFDLKLDQYENIDENTNSLKHQKIISIFLSSYTMYDSLLLFHQMGTGKSIAAITTSEKILNEKFGINKVFFFANTEIILYNLQREVLKFNPSYYPENFENLPPKTKNIRVKAKLAEHNYHFMTFTNLVKDLRRKNIKNYNNSLFIFDEIHDISKSETPSSKTSTTNPITNKDKYKYIQQLISTIKNKKVLLLSGTPMYDKASEIAKILNLIIPNKLQEDSDFNKTYLDTNLIMTDYNKIEKFVEKIKGFVSYLRIYNDIQVNYIGNVKLDIGNIYELQCEPSSIQNKTYNSIFEDDKYPNNTNINVKNLILDYIKENNKNNSNKIKIWDKRYDSDIIVKNLASVIKNTTNSPDSLQEFINTLKIIHDVFEDKMQSIFSLNSAQSSLFVFPNGSYGEKGFKQYITTKKVKKIGTKKLVPKYEFNKSIENSLYNLNNLEELKQYSIKYYNIIKNIKDNPNECHFIYSNLLFGSGILLFSMLLKKLLKYEECKNSKVKIPKKRFILLTGDNSTIQTQLNLIKRFNNPDNSSGKFIHVILGTDKVKQGVSFFHIQHIHINTPHWNFSKIEQVIARGIRIGSHKYLSKNSKVNVYLYSIVTDKKYSKDTHIYVDANKKDKSIKSVEHILKLNSVDCNLFYNRNYNPLYIDDTRDCEYNSCNYKCNGFDYNTDQIQESIDFSSYNEYYNICNVISSIQSIFKSQTYVTLPTLVNTFKLHPYDVLNCMYTIINKQIPIYNKFGMTCYIKELNDVFYATLSNNDDIDPFSHDYTSNIIINYSKPSKLTLEDKLSLLKDNITDYKIKTELYLSLDSSIKLSILIMSIINKYINRNYKYIDFVLKYHIQDYNYDYTNEFFYTLFNKSYYKINNDNSYSIIKSPTIEYDINYYETNAKAQNIKYIGILEGFNFKDNEEIFKIKELQQTKTTDLRKKLTGRACKSLDNKIKNAIAKNLELQPTIKSSALCTFILQKLKSLNLILNNNFDENKYFKSTSPPAFDKPQELIDPPQEPSPIIFDKPQELIDPQEPSPIIFDKPQELIDPQEPSPIIFDKPQELIDPPQEPSPIIFDKPQELIDPQELELFNIQDYKKAQKFILDNVSGKSARKELLDKWITHTGYKPQSKSKPQVIVPDPPQVQAGENKEDILLTIDNKQTAIEFIKINFDKKDGRRLLNRWLNSKGPRYQEKIIKAKAKKSDKKITMQFPDQRKQTIFEKDPTPPKPEPSKVVLPKRKIPISPVLEDDPKEVSPQIEQEYKSPLYEPLDKVDMDLYDEQTFYNPASPDYRPPDSPVYMADTPEYNVEGDKTPDYRPQQPGESDKDYEIRTYISPISESQPTPDYRPPQISSEIEEDKMESWKQASIARGEGWYDYEKGIVSNPRPAYNPASPLRPDNYPIGGTPPSPYLKFPAQVSLELSKIEYKPKLRYKPQSDLSKISVPRCVMNAIKNNIDIEKLEFDENIEMKLEWELQTNDFSNKTYPVIYKNKQHMINDIQLIGEGSYGKVYLMSLDNIPAKFAVKINSKKSKDIKRILKLNEEKMYLEMEYQQVMNNPEQLEKWTMSHQKIMNDLYSLYLKYKIDEYDLINKLPKECKYIIPSKQFGNESVIMLYGDTLWSNISNLTDKVAMDIVRVIGEMLRCLLINNFIYFDLKLENIMYRCLDGKNIEVFLIDIGSMIPDDLRYFASTHPPPEKMTSQNNTKIRYDGSVNTDLQFSNGMINVDNDSMEDVGKMYVWQLSLLYARLKRLVYNDTNMVFDTHIDTYNRNRLLYVTNPQIPPQIQVGFNFNNNRPTLEKFLC